ncbi:MAG: hypothetical protein LBQ21_04810 [Clostridiales Family XIII bacterium]|jgi:hypothetical protein|nr:hypothetical protein [Clostridiales Family XIII bacterium]
MTGHEKNVSIDYILARGLMKPQTARERVRAMLRGFGPRFIFWDTAYSLSFAGATLAGMLALLILAPAPYRCTAAVGVSPMLFLLITLFAETSERAGGLYELKQTCRYTVRQITALRVICYSVVGVVFSCVCVAISAESVSGFFSLLPLCLSVFFLCAVAELSAIRRLRHKWAISAVPVIWVLASCAIPLAFGEDWELFLRGFPVFLGILIAAIGAAILAIQIRELLTEGTDHVIA